MAPGVRPHALPGFPPSGIQAHMTAKSEPRMGFNRHGESAPRRVRLRPRPARQVVRELLQRNRQFVVFDIP